MSAGVEIAKAIMQPATKYRVPCVGTVKNSKRRLLYCARCRRGRWASKLYAQVFYDGVRFYFRKWCGVEK